MRIISARSVIGVKNEGHIDIMMLKFDFSLDLKFESYLWLDIN